MSQCHDPYDVIEAPTLKDIASNRAQSAAQCHDSYESVDLTAAASAVIAAKTVTVAKAAAVKNKARPGRRIVVGVDGSGAS